MSRDYLLTAPQVHAAHRAHMAGWSLRALARIHWREWGYASSDSAYEGLRHAMRLLNLPVRDQRDATIHANTVHGHLRIVNVPPSAPGHADLLAHRRHLRARAA